MAATGTQLLNGMVEQFVFGDGPSGAATLVEGQPIAVRRDALEQAEVRLLGGAFEGADGKDALQKSIVILSAREPQAAAAALPSRSNITTYLFIGGGLVAAWFLFIRK